MDEIGPWRWDEDQMIKTLLIGAAALATTTALATGAAQAEATISVYGGASFSPHSTVETTAAAGAAKTRRNVGWDGASFEMPPYYGVRATWWMESMPSLGFAVDFTHAKVEADPMPAGFTTLEFTDGINFLTANALYRYQSGSNFTPYAGVGVGLTIPHVEVGFAGGFSTSEYQVTGVAAQALVGVDYKITDNWSVFVEGKSTYGDVDADLTGGGSLETEIISNQISFGITYKLF